MAKKKYGPGIGSGGIAGNDKGISIKDFENKTAEKAKTIPHEVVAEASTKAGRVIEKPEIDQTACLGSGGITSPTHME